MDWWDHPLDLYTPLQDKVVWIIGDTLFPHVHQSRSHECIQIIVYDNLLNYYHCNAQYTETIKTQFHSSISVPKKKGKQYSNLNRGL